MINHKPAVSVLFVCMGNICRSPTAHGVFESMVEQAGLSQRILVDSAATHGYHIGNPPDLRSQETARSHGIDLSQQRAREFEAEDFIKFDFVLAMDGSNLANMSAIRPENAHTEAELMLDYSDNFPQTDVSDPYFGHGGFELVFDMISDASEGLLRHIRQQYSF